MKFGIVGTNFISELFMEAANELGEIEVVSVCSKKVENANDFARKFEIANVYETYQEMCKSNTIQAVYLAVPNSLHYELSIYFLKHKIPVLCEKPLASNDREVKKMVECARKNNSYLQDGIMPLYTENFKKTKKALAKLGKLRRGVIVYGKYSSRYKDYLDGMNPTTFRRELSTGSIMDLGVYAISIAIGLFGKPKSIHASGILLESGVDGLGTIIFSYDSFELVILHSKVTDTLIKTEIQGENGNIYIDPLNHFNDVYFINCETKKKEQISEEAMGGMIWELKEFLHCVKAGKIQSDKVPHQLSIDIHEILTECREQIGVVFPSDNF